MDLAALFVASMTTAAHAADAVAVYIGGSGPGAAPGVGSAVDEDGAARKDHPATPAVQRTHTVLRSRLFGVLVGLLVVSVAYYEVHTTAAELGSVVYNSPKGSLTTPSGIVELCAAIKRVADGRLPSVVVLIVLVYLTLQTFCIPGTIALNAVTGALLGVRIGLPLCVLLGTTGAVSCYTLSAVAGTRVVGAVDRRLMKGQGVTKLRASVAKYRSELFAYLLFLRLTPILPNWLINLGSPVAAVPLGHFALATFFGITPQTYLSVRAGTVAQAGSLKAIVTPWDTVCIAAIGLVVLAATKLRKRFTTVE